MTKIIFMTIFNYGCKGTIFRVKKTIIFIFKRKGAKIFRKVGIFRCKMKKMNNKIIKINPG